MHNFMKVNLSAEREQPPRHVRLKVYKEMARGLEYPLAPPTDQELETGFDLSIKFIDDLIPRYNDTMDLIAMAIPAKTTQALMAILILDLAEATFSKLKLHYAQSVVAAGPGLPPEIKELMAAMGMSDAEIAEALDRLQGKPNDG